MKYITTSKGTFGINTDYKGIKLSSIIEEEASEIVDNHLHIKGIYYDYLFIERYIGTSSAVHSLYSLIESHGIEITKNTYIFKV